ncbi:MAG: DUF6338 family protein [Rhodospirillaceae bacterium]|nr:DUF6338 family protein [Rhodospirillaceae bacterium]
MNVSWASNEAVSVLIFLLPGFVAAGVFHSLISNPKPSGIDTIVRAFVFTIIVHVIARFIGLSLNAVELNILQNETWQITFLVTVSIILGLFSAYAWNNDLLHKRLRRLNVTRQSSYQSAQYSAFAFHRNCFVVLHLRGERRLYGWPREWPSRPDDQHFLIEDCEWLGDEERRQLEGVSHILVPASEVEMIEFLPSNLDSQRTE